MEALLQAHMHTRNNSKRKRGSRTRARPITLVKTLLRPVRYANTPRHIFVGNFELPERWQRRAFTNSSSSLEGQSSKQLGALLLRAGIWRRGSAPPPFAWNNTNLLENLNTTGMPAAHGWLVVVGGRWLVVGGGSWLVVRGWWGRGSQESGYCCPNNSRRHFPQLDSPRPGPYGRTSVGGREPVANQPAPRC